MALWSVVHRQVKLSGLVHITIRIFACFVLYLVFIISSQDMVARKLASIYVNIAVSPSQAKYSNKKCHSHRHLIKKY